MRQRLEDLLTSRAPLGRRAFWLFALQCAGLYALALLAEGISGWPLRPVLCLLLLWPLTRAGQRRLQDVGSDAGLMWVFSVPFAFVQIVKLLSKVAPGSVAPLTQSSIAVIPFCQMGAAGVAVILAHYWIRPDRNVQA